VLATTEVSAVGGTLLGAFGVANIDVDVAQFILGNNSIVATYNGGTNFNASVPSAPIAINCTAGCGNSNGQSLTLAFSQLSPATGIVSAGASLQAVVSVGANGGFSGGVNMTCSVTGTKSSDTKIPQCSFNPALVTVLATTNGASSTVTVTTTAPTTTAALAPIHHLWAATRGVVSLACLVFLGFSTRRRSLTLLRVLLCMVVLGGVMACGGGGGGGGGGTPQTVPGTTPDTYTINFNATDAATGTLTAHDYFTIQVN
jgi:hypothetical protein